MEANTKELIRLAVEALNEKKAKDMMNKQDKKRASYYNYYTSKRWGDCRSYDLSISTSDLGPEACVDIIIQYASMKFNK